MNSWSNVFLWAKEWLELIWDNIFGVEIFDGVSGGLLLGGTFAICVAIWFIHYFRDNTNAHMGGKHD